MKFVVSQNKPLHVLRRLISRVGFCHYATLQHEDKPITHGINDNNVKRSKIVSMIMKYHNHKLQTKPMTPQGKATQQLRDNKKTI